jgi:hypothetical protein
MLQKLVREQVVYKAKYFNMKNSIKAICLVILMSAVVVLAGCNNSKNSNIQKQATRYAEGTFGYDLDFFKKHQKALVLKRNDAMILIAPGYQGRILTSTASGLEGKSLGWINYNLIKSGEDAPHFNNYGGEERFWLGPEGGQYSIYFPPGVDFDFENWQVPAPIDSDPFELVESSETQAVFKHNIKLKNYSNFDFFLRVDRTVKLLDNTEITKESGMKIPTSLNTVAYQSVNKITNTGKIAWTKDSGLLSVWVLGQLISSPTNTIIVPYVEGENEELGPIVNDNYFGKVPSERLKVDNGIIYFKADGKQRGKIGLSPSRAKNYLGSYDSNEKLLTLVFYNKPDEHDGYVNSMWEIQDKPFSGDVINSYNDGPLEDGTQLGPFYELETSSAAANLQPGKSLTHTCTTIHISGDQKLLNKVVKGVFGIEISDINSAFND